MTRRIGGDSTFDPIIMSLYGGVLYTSRRINISDSADQERYFLFNSTPIYHPLHDFLTLSLRGDRLEWEAQEAGTINPIFFVHRGTTHIT